MFRITTNAVAATIVFVLSSIASAQQTPGVYYDFHVQQPWFQYQPAVTISETRATTTCNPSTWSCTGQITAPPGFSPTPDSVAIFDMPIADPTGHSEVLEFYGQQLLDQGVFWWTLTYGGFAFNVCGQISCVAETGSPQTAITLNWKLADGGAYTDYITFAQGQELLPRPYPFPVSPGQTVRLKVSLPPAPMAATGPVPPGGPVEGTLGFLDTEGNAIVAPQVVTVSAGKPAWIDLAARKADGNPSESPESRAHIPSPHIIAILIGHSIVVPIVGPAPGASFAPPLQATLELFDSRTGVESLLVNHPPQPVEPVFAPSFGPQTLAMGQTIAIHAAALPPSPMHPPQPCIAVLSFADANGMPVGPSMPVQLMPGQVKSLELSADDLGLKHGDFIELQSMVMPAMMMSGTAPNVSECLASAEVFDSHTGLTLTYQAGNAAR